jgi:signal transduction histidine kinase/ActR/RegA family two-component response regulator
MNSNPSPLSQESLPDSPGGRPGSSVLQRVHEVLLASSRECWSLDDCLGKLAESFDARGIGLAGLLEGVPTVQHWMCSDAPSRPTPVRPWEEAPQLLSLCQGQVAVASRSLDGTRAFLTAGFQEDGILWVVWLSDSGERRWIHEDQAALTLAAVVLARSIPTGSNSERRQNWMLRAQRQQRLESASGVVSRLAHDFNNVLTGVLGFIELSLGQVPSASVPHQYLTEAYQAAELGTKMVHQLSLFSRRSSPRNPSAAVAMVAEELSKEQQVHLNVPAGLPAVAMDGDSLRGLLKQLLNNAREAIRDGGAITISARVAELTIWDCMDLLGSPSPGRFVEMTVTDTGTGLSPEARQRIFMDPFFSTKPRHRGLGLASVYGTLQVHRGGLRVDPGPERGTIVRFYVPLAAARETWAQGTPAGASPSVGDRLLVVDDDPQTLHFMCTTLERAGYRVHRATDGSQALDSYTAAAEPFRLVVSDVVMPQMTGFDLAQRLLDHDPRVNVLFTSGQIPIGFLPEDFAGRDFGLLPKPFRTDGLLQAVQAALLRRTNPEPSLPTEQTSGKRP